MTKAAAATADTLSSTRRRKAAKPAEAAAPVSKSTSKSPDVPKEKKLAGLGTSLWALVASIFFASSVYLVVLHVEDHRTINELDAVVGALNAKLETYEAQAKKDKSRLCLPAMPTISMPTISMPWNKRD